METSFTIPTPDGQKIYGVLHSPKLPTTAAVILVHGLTGQMHEFLHLTFARYLVNSGIAVLRFNQYGDLEGARRFHETTIGLHVADTQTVLRYARTLGFSKLALIGHSLGAPVAIAAVDSQVQALVLWDPTASPAERIKEWCTFDQKHQLSYLDWEMRIILGEDWIQDAKTFPDSFQQLSQLRLPVKIIAAELGGKLHHCERYRTALARKHDFAIVPKAGHTFVEEGAIEGLSKETAEWLEVVLEKAQTAPI